MFFIYLIIKISSVFPLKVSFVECIFAKIQIKNPKIRHGEFNIQIPNIPPMPSNCLPCTPFPGASWVPRVCRTARGPRARWSRISSTARSDFAKRRQVSLNLTLTSLLIGINRYQSIRLSVYRSIKCRKPCAPSSDAIWSPTRAARRVRSTGAFLAPRIRRRTWKVTRHRLLMGNRRKRPTGTRKRRSCDGSIVIWMPDYDTNDFSCWKFEFVEFIKEEINYFWRTCWFFKRIVNKVYLVDFIT